MNTQEEINIHPEEFRVLSEKEFYNRKREVTGKISQILGLTAQALENKRDELFKPLPPEISGNVPKISRGENYLGYPWMILDYPRYFTKDNVFALRILCWFGNNFSVTLHISGNYFREFSTGLFNGFGKLSEMNFLAGIHENPWQHHHEADNYRLIKELDFEEYKNEAQQRQFLKLSRALPLDNYKKLPQFTIEAAKALFSLLPQR